MPIVPPLYLKVRKIFGENIRLKLSVQKISIKAMPGLRSSVLSI